MNKPELISIIADKANITKKDAEIALTTVFDAIAETLKSGEKVVLSGFGTFEVRARSARQGRNIQTGATILIDGSKAPVFKAAKVLKDAING